MQDDPGPIPAELVRPDENTSAIARKDVRAILLACAGWLWVLAYGVMWKLESWQRPLGTDICDERVWLALSCAGLLGLVLFPWQWSSFAHVVRKFILLLAGSALLLGGLPVFCEHLAVNSLKSMVDDEISNHVGSLGLGRRAAPPTLAKKIHDLLEQIGVGPPHWLSQRVRNRPIQPAHVLVAASRLSVRMKVADIMVRDSTRADYLMGYWKEYFPSFTGPDVTLECRREWLRNLEVQSKQNGASLSTRQASLLMMALIILTDPPEFERWRIPVRDAMIDLREPLIHRWSGASQTFWYRALDALLALDPPESCTRLVAPMVVDGDAFKQAMEVPVRGLVGNFDAFLPIFENAKDIDDLFLYWQSAGECLEAHPDSFDAHTADRIRIWRRDTLFRWLMARGDGSKYDLSGRHIPVDHVIDLYPPPPLADAQQAQLVKQAESWISTIRDHGPDDADNAAHYLDRIAAILPYLQGPHADALCRSLVPILLQTERFLIKSNQGYSCNEAWAECLWFGQPRMTEEQQLLLRDRLTIPMANLSAHQRSYSMMLCIDAWSKYPALPRAHWLAMAWSRGLGWRMLPKGKVPSTRPRADTDRLPVPEVSEEDVEAFARLLDFILHEPIAHPSGKTLTKKKDVPVEVNSSSRMIHRRMSMLKMHAGSDPAWMRNALKEDLAGMGLYRMNEELALSLLDRVEGGNFQPKEYLLRPELSDMIFGRMLKNPQVARQMVADCLAGTLYDGCLNNLILAMESSDPDDEVVHVVWDELGAGSGAGARKQMAFGALIRISHLVSETERLAMRRDYRDSKLGKAIAGDRNDWGYGITMNHHLSASTGTSLSISGASLTYPEGYDVNPLAHPGGGIGIPWEEDALSAEQSWGTTVDRQLYKQPRVRTSSHHREVFAYVAFGFDWENEMETGRFSQPKPRLAAPFPPTPWQKARALHEKRPDLNFR